MSSFNGRFLFLSLARSLMLRMILYESVLVCVSVGFIMFGIVFIVLFEQYTLSNLCFTFFYSFQAYLKLKWTYTLLVYGSNFLYLFTLAVHSSVWLVCICDVRIFCCCCRPVIQIITNKYSLSPSLCLQFDSTSFTLLENGAPKHKKILKPRSECSFVCALLLPQLQYDRVRSVGSPTSSPLPNA
uniref:(northern house mosquito) hypothetical protein n=1 Tax=Culex pipiens TaxID=7175 RepID=A0A8D8FFH9_CULPI